MTPDEPPNPPRKGSWRRWVVAAACVAAIVVAVLLLKAPAPERVSIWFVGSTNESGKKMFVFQGTNGIPGQVEYFVCVVTGAIRHVEIRTLDPEALNAVSPRYSQAFGKALAGATFSLTTSVPADSAAFYVVWALNDRGADATRWGRFKVGCYRFFRTHHMPALAYPFRHRLEAHFIPGTDFKE